MVAPAAGSLPALLAEIPDPRGHQGLRHPLAATLAATVCGILTGARGCEAIAQWVRNQDRTIWHALGFRRKPPCANMYRKLLRRLPAEMLEAVIARWMRDLVPDPPPDDLQLGLARKLTIWSAACSTGQEAYSIAMLLREHFPDLCTGKVQIIGTDIADEVLARARAGAFTQIEMNRGLPANLLARYFQRKGMQWEITPNLRDLVSFSKLNFIEPWPPLPQIDVVFLRNVLIYFSPATKKQILEKVRSVMAPHSVLFLGAAETTMNLDSSFVRVQVDNQVFYRLKQE